MLRCLTDKIEELKAEACKKEVYYFEKMEVREGLRGGALLPIGCVRGLCVWERASCPSVAQWGHASPSSPLHAGIAPLRPLPLFTPLSHPLLPPLSPLQVTDFKNDVLLAEACRKDVDQFCATVEPGKKRGSV